MKICLSNFSANECAWPYNYIYILCTAYRLPRKENFCCLGAQKIHIEEYLKMMSRKNISKCKGNFEE
jgi:hypothetical protein